LGWKVLNLSKEDAEIQCPFFYFISSKISSKTLSFSNPSDFGISLCQGRTFFSPLDKEGLGEI
jgi:hypothetical protein